MKIVIAMDLFKGSPSARDACLCIANGINSVIPEVNIIIKPIADGGE